MQGDVVKSDAAVNRVAQRRAGPSAPWTLNADIQEDEEPEDSESCMDELSDGQQEFVPYCVMPYVERLLQVSCMSYHMPWLANTATFSWHTKPAAHSPVHFTLMHATAVCTKVDMNSVLCCSGVHDSDVTMEANVRYG